VITIHFSQYNLNEPSRWNPLCSIVYSIDPSHWIPKLTGLRSRRKSRKLWSLARITTSQPHCWGTLLLVDPFQYTSIFVNSFNPWKFCLDFNIYSIWNCPNRSSKQLHSVENHLNNKQDSLPVTHDSQPGFTAFEGWHRLEAGPVAA